MLAVLSSMVALIKGNDQFARLPADDTLCTTYCNVMSISQIDSTNQHLAAIIGQHTSQLWNALKKRTTICLFSAVQCSVPDQQRR